MKKEMAEIEGVENKLKEELDKFMKERQICKDKCDRIKANIRTNRTKFFKNVEEYGKDAELNEEADSLEDEMRIGQSQRNSIAPSADGLASRASIQSNQQQIIELEQPGAAVVCQGFEYHLENTKIDYTFKDEEIAYLSL